MCQMARESVLRLQVLLPRALTNCLRFSSRLVMNFRVRMVHLRISKRSSQEAHITHLFPRTGRWGHCFTYVGVDILASTRSYAGLLARWGACARRKGLLRQSG